MRLILLVLLRTLDERAGDRDCLGDEVGLDDARTTFRSGLLLPDRRPGDREAGAGRGPRILPTFWARACVPRHA